MKAPEPGDLRIWWMPQVPMKEKDIFHVPVASVEDGRRVFEILASYDLYQYDKRIKPDFSNMGGLEIYNVDADGDGNPGWIDWEDPETCDGMRTVTDGLDFSGIWQWRDRIPGGARHERENAALLRRVGRSS